MYLSFLSIENFRCFGEKENAFELTLKPGLTALVGENDSGKTAVIDALRFVLGTTDQEWYRLEDDDFNSMATPREIRVTCKFEGLTAEDLRGFAECLTYGAGVDDPPVLFVNWTAKDTGETGRRHSGIRTDLRSGKVGDGPVIAVEARDLLRATYLRPLRDAERSLTAGRGSRLSQILHHTEQVKTAGIPYDSTCDPQTIDLAKLNVLGIGDLANDLLKKQKGIVDTRQTIDTHLDRLAISKDEIKSSIMVSGATSSDDIRLRQLLEKLNLELGGLGQLGLGSNNLLFMACELLLLSQEDEGNKLLLIEEPEAHLHTQRQLRVMQSLQEQAAAHGLQIIVTTHSPNLASAIELNNMVIIRNGKAFSLAEGLTELSTSDYRFLKRFLDVTKANLFFACGVSIVEGDAENILLPTLATLLDRDFTAHGVSIVNVGGVGLRRYARIFQRKNMQAQLDIPVACITDMDVMPDCAPAIIGKVEPGGPWPATAKRRWRAKRDIGDETALNKYRREKREKPSGQSVMTFVSDEWTLEYDLALGPKDAAGKFSTGLAEDIYVAACLASDEETISSGTKEKEACETKALADFAKFTTDSVATEGCSVQEVIASRVYAQFASNGVSKAIAAQYLADRLRAKRASGQLTPVALRNALPVYLTSAIDYVTGGNDAGQPPKKSNDA
jgi:putative ATP-dependent endonuclease of OLD family